MIDQYESKCIVFIKNWTKLTFLFKRRDGLEIWKKLYSRVQNGTYGQPTYGGVAV
jgi:hypothetical protein